jgi:hypothetical protein
VPRINMLQADVAQSRTVIGSPTPEPPAMLEASTAVRSLHWRLCSGKGIDK